MRHLAGNSNPIPNPNHNHNHSPNHNRNPNPNPNPDQGRSERGADEEVDPVWPAIATLLLAFFVARAFGSVYECVVG